MSNFLNYHIIQSIPINCCNRDDLGNIKTAMIGGSLRQRISSQCFKRAVRSELENRYDLSWRTTKIPFKMFKDLTEKGMSKSETLEKIGKVFTGTKGKAKKKVRIKDWNKIVKGDIEITNESLTTEMLIFISEREYNKIIDVCLSSDIKNLNEILSDGEHRFGASIALFGRMFADHKELDVPAASSFAQSFTTHEIAQESDYFSALDDLNKGGEGAGHLDYSSFSTGTFYRHITLDIDTLKSNLLNTENDIIQLCCNFVIACYNAFPKGRINSYLANTIPSYVLIEKSDFPLSFANAFEKPIRSNNGYIDLSIEVLKTHRDQLVQNGYKIDAYIESTEIKNITNFIKENFS